jgi:hypothetical protein
MQRWNSVHNCALRQRLREREGEVRDRQLREPDRCRVHKSCSKDVKEKNQPVRDQRGIKRERETERDTEWGVNEHCLHPVSGP